MSQKIYQIDAFADLYFQEILLLFVPLDKLVRCRYNAKIAAENNLAETAFTVPRKWL